MIPLRDVNPNEKAPVVTLALILANAGAFMIELQVPEARMEGFFLTFGLVPAHYAMPDFPGPLFLPFFTSMFLHGGWMHLIGNMWSLWLFGDNVEDRLGHGRFLVFYLLAGLGAGAAHLYLNQGSPVPTIGASGAIAGVMGAYAWLYPHARILTVLPLGFIWQTIQMPAVLFIGIWAVFFNLVPALGQLGNKMTGGIAFWAHLGGALAGVVLVWLLAPSRRRARAPWE